MDWIAIGTLLAALVAAVAGVWAAMISQRQLSLTKQASEPFLPIVEATYTALTSHPDWSAIHMRMWNRAEIPIDLVGITLIAPKNVGLLSYNKAMQTAPDGSRALFDPLPTSELTKTLAGRSALMDRRSSFNRDGAFTAVTTYAHCSPSEIAGEPHPRLSLEMRWRDHTTKTFEMAVNIIKPNTA